MSNAKWGPSSYKGVWLICEEGKITCWCNHKVECTRRCMRLSWHSADLAFTEYSLWCSAPHNSGMVVGVWNLNTYRGGRAGKIRSSGSSLPTEWVWGQSGKFESLSHITPNKTKLGSKIESIYMTTKEGILLYHCKANRKHIYFIP